MIQYYVVYDFQKDDGTTGSSSCTIAREFEIRSHADMEAMVHTIKSEFGYELVLITNVIRYPI